MKMRSNQKFEDNKPVFKIKFHISILSTRYDIIQYVGSLAFSLSPNIHSIPVCIEEWKKSYQLKFVLFVA